MKHLSPKDIGVVAFGILLVLYGYDALIWYSYRLHDLYLHVSPALNMTYLAVAWVVLFVGVEIYESKSKNIAYVIKALFMSVIYIILLKLGATDLAFLSDTNKVIYGGIISIVLGVMVVVVRPMSLTAIYKKTVSDLTRNTPH